jgi:hypothetical protein
MDIQKPAGPRIPALPSCDAEIAAEVASAQGNRERWREEEFIADLGLDLENIGPRTGVASTGWTCKTVHAALMSA